MGYRATAGTHKVQVSAAKAEELLKSGANAQLIADYGSFKLMQVDEQSMAALSVGSDVEIRDDYNEILLNAGVIDTASQHGKSLRGMKLNGAGKQLHIVQFAGPIRPEWYKELEATGVRVVTYIPNNAYVVYGDIASLKLLQRHIDGTSVIQWNGDYLNDYKLDPSIHKMQTEAYSIQLIKDEEANAATLGLINQRQSRDGVIQEALGYVNVNAYLTVQDLYAIAARPDVFSIQPRPEMKKVDERQNMIVSGHVAGNGITGPGYLAWLSSKGFTQAQFTASGFGVDVSDSGLDNATPATPNHFGLYVNGDINGTSRVVYARLEGSPNGGSTIQGCDGHGTINAHIIGGYTNVSGAPFQDSEGYSYGLGVAPFVKVGSSVVFDPGTFTSPNYENLQSRAYRDAMRVSSNSWGANTSAYTTDAQRYDALVRDAQPATSAVPNPGNQEMVILFAAGNSGPSGGTVGSPGTAKNVITVGASENVHPFGAADQCGVTDNDANSLNDIVGFSSRGPTADGRKKPDIVAPGTHVSGGVAQAEGQRNNPPGNPNGQALGCFDASGTCAGPGSSNFWPVGQQWSTASSGTSHSTPAVAGGAALVRQYFINQGIAPPSAAMTKAYLMNSARFMTGASANDNLFSNNQGMGLMDLGMAFDGTERLLDDQNPANLFTTTGETRTFNGVISDTAKPFRVTLAWTDAPGATSGSAWKNNLDLSVTIGGNTYKGNVFTKDVSTTGGTADGSNNVESVFLPAGAEGAYTITVTATNINSDGVPGNTSTLDQDFALIVYNTCTTAAPSVSNVTAVTNGDNRIDVSWDSNGAQSYNVYRATTAGGPYTRIKEGATSPYADEGVSGGTTYYYVVRAVECAESPNSAEVSATATGLCTLPPTFAGVDAVANAAAATCGTTVSWNAATPICGGTLSYSVYRSTVADFTPSVGNRIAMGLTGTSFADDLNLASGTKYYYVVRATEVSNATIEDTNTVRKSGTPTGIITPGANFYDDLDGSRPANATAYWIASTQSGTSGTMNIVDGCHFQSPTKSYRLGAANTSCGGSYPNSVQSTLSLGGDGSVEPAINGFSLPSNATAPELTFNVWYATESRYDGVWLVYSTTSATGPWTNVGDAATTTAPYISAGGYDNTLQSTPSIRIWTGSTAANQGSNGALKAVTVNLNAMKGQKVWFGFKFHSDNIIQAEGFYLDNVRINSDNVASCTTNTPPPGPAVAYRVEGFPASVQAGAEATFSVTALDSVGQVATGYNGTASFTSSDALATLPADATFTSGVASDVAITFRKAGAQTVTAKDTTDETVVGTGGTTVTPGAAAGLTFTTQPGNAAAGSPITPAVKVGMTDAFGNTLTSGTNSITVALGNNPGSSTLSGTLTANAVAGVATFSNLSLNKVGEGYTLVASSPDLTGATSAGFKVNPGAAAKLVIQTQPANGAVGVLSPVKVALVDQFENLTTSTANVTAALEANPAGGSLFGTTTVAAVAGVATLDNLQITKVGAGYSLALTSGALPKVVTSTFDLAAGAPYRAIITQQPTDTTAGAVITPAVKVLLQDRYGNTSLAATTPVTVYLANNSAGARLGGTTTVDPVDGVATFSDLEVNREGRNYTLVAGASGIYSDASVGFDVSRGSQGQGPKLVLRSAPTSVSADATLGTIEVELQDAQGRVDTSGSYNVTLSLGSNMAGGQLLGTTTVASANGVAKFEGLSLRKAGGGYTLVATAPDFSATASEAFTVTPGAAASYTLTLPSSVPAGEEVSLSAKAYDAHGNMAANYAGSAKVSSSDAKAVLPATVTFVEGEVRDLKVTFKTAGLKTITLTDAQTSTLLSSLRINVTPFGAPVVSVTNPAGGTDVSGMVSITAEGTVAAGATIEKLAILVDGVEIASGTEGTLTGSWDSSEAANGTHSITAVITDSAGNVVSSAPVIVATQNDSCGCGATSGTDASIYLGLLVLAKYMLGRRRRQLAA